MESTVTEHSFLSPEFVVDPKSVITERIALYYQAIEIAEDENKKTRVQTLQAGIQVKYLLLIPVQHPLIRVTTCWCIIIKCLSLLFVNCYWIPYWTKLMTICDYAVTLRLLSMPKILHKQNNSLLCRMKYTPSVHWLCVLFCFVLPVLFSSLYMYLMFIVGATPPSPPPSSL